MTRVYLDNAATTWPKCESAVVASLEFIRNCGASTGRGAYASAQIADRCLEQARSNLAQLVGIGDAQDIAFCSSGTHALNVVLQGLLRPGEHVLTTSMEHNSVLRPLAHMRRAGLEFDVIEADSLGRAQTDAAGRMVRNTTKALITGHASNVTGAANDLHSWGEFAQQHGLKLIVDASQTVGYLPLDTGNWHVDALAAAGHKGLRALQGTGFVYLSKSCQNELRPMLYGGTGSASERIDELSPWPLSVEVGNLNLPGIVSMAAAADELLRIAPLENGWIEVFQHLVEGLQSLPGVHTLGAYDFSCRPPPFVPVVSLQVEGWSAHDLAAILDTNFQIEVRAGWHCAALVHDSLGTASSGGTLRMSTGRSTRRDEIDYTLRALKEILESNG